MSALTDLLDTLLREEARLKALGEAIKPTRAKAQAMLLERFRDEGVDRLSRPAGLVSVIKPSPYVEVSRPETLCEWLVGQGRDDLVTRRVELLDHATVAGAVATLLDTVDAERWQDAVDALRTAVDIRSAPAPDWADHVQWQATGDGTLVTPDGEVIPGCRHVVPVPRSVRVSPSKEAREAAMVEVAQGGAA